MNPEELDRYWVNDSVLEDAAPFGIATVGIVDENEGGIIAYVHEANAARIIAALYGGN